MGFPLATLAGGVVGIICVVAVIVAQNQTYRNENYRNNDYPRRPQYYDFDSWNNREQMKENQPPKKRKQNKDIQTDRVIDTDCIETLLYEKKKELMSLNSY